MNPDLQAVYQQMQQAQQHAIFMGYSTYAAILVCAVFSVLTFWKLCQIKTLLQSSTHAYPARQTVSTVFQTSLFTDASKPETAPDDSRFQPKN
jgi:hypothetical protein